MKRSLLSILAVLLIAGMVSSLASCKQKPKGPVKVEVFQFKVEIVEQLDKFVADFEAAHPDIDIVMDTVGGGQDYGAALRQRANSGEMPVIFNHGGNQELIDWADYVEPLNDQPFASRAFAGTLDQASKDGNVYGLPYGLEGYGVMYNKKILQAAGYSADDLKAVDSLSKLKELFADIESKKGDLGIKTVLSFSIGGSAWWTASIHTFNFPFAYQDDPLGFIDKARKGEVKLSQDPKMKAYVDMIDVFMQYSFDNLTTIEYNDQVTSFAKGETAFMHQGNWTIGQLQEIDPNIDVAFMPVPLGDDMSYDSIPVGVPMYWAVNTQASEEEKAAAKKFLDYMVSSPRGHKFITEECQFIPAIGGIPMENADPLAASILEFSEAGKTIPWVWFALPNGYCNGPTSPVVKALQQYYDDKDKAAMLASFEENIIKMN
jgi:raffinose/stachyose/melibiose transport system substrate-binding protein